MAEQKTHRKEEGQEVSLVRILGKDIPGMLNILPGLTRIKGISWALSNAICKSLQINSEKKIQELEKKEIESIETFIEKGDIPGFLKNRQKDFDEGSDQHLIGSDLSLKQEFDVKRLKKIRSYRGTRHSLGLPVRGQRTRSNFRRNRKKSGAVGVNKKK